MFDQLEAIYGLQQKLSKNPSNEIFLLQLLDETENFLSNFDFAHQLTKDEGRRLVEVIQSHETVLVAFQEHTQHLAEDPSFIGYIEKAQSAHCRYQLFFYNRYSELFPPEKAGYLQTLWDISPVFFLRVVFQRDITPLNDYDLVYQFLSSDDKKEVFIKAFFDHCENDKMYYGNDDLYEDRFKQIYITFQNSLLFLHKSKEKQTFLSPENESILAHNIHLFNHSQASQNGRVMIVNPYLLNLENFLDNHNARGYMWEYYQHLSYAEVSKLRRLNKLLGRRIMNVELQEKLYALERTHYKLKGVFNKSIEDILWPEHIGTKGNFVRHCKLLLNTEDDFDPIEYSQRFDILFESYGAEIPEMSADNVMPVFLLAAYFDDQAYSIEQDEEKRFPRLKRVIEYIHKDLFLDMARQYPSIILNFLEQYKPENNAFFEEIELTAASAVEAPIIPLPQLYKPHMRADSVKEPLDEDLFSDQIYKEEIALTQRANLICNLIEICYRAEFITKDEYDKAFQPDFMKTIIACNEIHDLFYLTAYFDRANDPFYKLFYKLSTGRFNYAAMHREITEKKDQFSLKQKLLLYFGLIAHDPIYQTYKRNAIFLSHKEYVSMENMLIPLRKEFDHIKIQDIDFENDDALDISKKLQDRVLKQLTEDLPSLKEVLYGLKKIQKEFEAKVTFTKKENELRDLLYLMPIYEYRAESLTNLHVVSQDLLKFPLVNQSNIPQTEDYRDEWFYWQKAMLAIEGNRREMVSQLMLRYKISISNSGYFADYKTTYEYAASCESKKELMKKGIHWLDEQLYYFNHSYCDFFEHLQAGAQKGRDYFVNDQEFLNEWQAHLQRNHDCIYEFSEMVTLLDMVQKLPTDWTDRQVMVYFQNNMPEHMSFFEKIYGEDYQEVTNEEQNQLSSTLVFTTEAFKPLQEKLNTLNTKAKPTVLASGQQMATQLRTQLQANSQIVKNSVQNLNGRTMNASRFAQIRPLQQTLQHFGTNNGYRASNRMFVNRQAMPYPKPNFAARSTSRPGMRVHSGIPMGNGVIMAELSNQFLQRFFPQFSSKNPRLVGEINTDVFGLSSLATKFFTDYKAVQKETGLKLGQILRNNRQAALSTWRRSSRYFKGYGKTLGSVAGVYGLYKLFEKK